MLILRLSRLIVVFLCANVLPMDAQILDIGKISQPESIKPYLQMYADSAGNITIDDITKSGKNLPFVPFSKNLINSNIPIHWFSLYLTNSNKKTKNIYLGLGDICEYITVYALQNDSLIQSYTSGAYVPVDEKEIKTGRDNIIMLEIPAQSTYRYYIKIENKTLFGKQFLMYISEYFMVYVPRAFDDTFTKGRIFNAFYYGAIFIMFFYNVFLAFILRSREYASYVVFCVAFFIFNIFSDGYPSETFLSHLPNRDRLIRIFVAPTTFIAYITFSRIYLRTNIIAPKIDMFFWVLLALLLACHIPIAFGYWWVGRNAITYMLVAIIAYYAVVSIICYRRGYKPALYYIIGNAMLLTSGLIYSFYLLSIVPHNSATRIIEYLPQVASIFELAIFSLGLAQRIKIAEAEKADAQVRTIQLLIEQEKIVLGQNEVLEASVRLRTEELSATNEELNVTNNDLNNSLLQLEREKTKSDQLLLNILPEQVALELKENGSAIPCQYEMVSILFADFVNFTHYAESNPPQEITQKLNDFFLDFDMICARNGLEKIKTIGDCYMAAGGLPMANNTNAQDSIRASIEILNIVKNTEWEIRIGIHTGPVVAGVIGIHKFAYDVWGDTVNVASRMEAASENNRVNISEQTYKLIKNEFNCTHRGKVNAKNKGLIDMYFVDL